MDCGSGKITEPHAVTLGLETDIRLDMTGRGSGFQQRHLMHRRRGTVATWRPICRSGILPISKLLESFQQILGTTQEWIISGSQCRTPSVISFTGKNNPCSHPPTLPQCLKRSTPVATFVQNGPRLPWKGEARTSKDIPMPKRQVVFSRHLMKSGR